MWSFRRRRSDPASSGIMLTRRSSMMAARLLWLIALVSCLSAIAGLSASSRPKTDSSTSSVRGSCYRRRGTSHHLPEISFTSAASGKQLYRVELGAGMLDTRYIDPSDPKADPFPIVRFKVLTLPEFSTPIVFAAVMHAGGSDCSYMGALVGDVTGKMSTLLPPLQMVNAEGGYAIGELEKGAGIEFAAWNMIWGDGESHYDPHDELGAHLSIRPSDWEVRVRQAVRSQEVAAGNQIPQFAPPDSRFWVLKRDRGSAAKAGCHHKTAFRTSCLTVSALGGSSDAALDGE